MAFDPAKERKGFARELFLLRRDLGQPKLSGLTQKEFADRFGLTIGMLKDVEQSRVKPSRPLRVLVATISLNPELVARAAEIVAKGATDEA